MARTQQIRTHQTKAHKICLIEDDWFTRELLQMDLEAAGHTVTSYANGNAALSDLPLKLPDILITDIMMMDGEGLGSIRFARDLYPNLRIIAISTQPDYLKFAAELGADEIVLKPFRSTEFVSKLIGFGANAQEQERQSDTGQSYRSDRVGGSGGARRAVLDTSV